MSFSKLSKRTFRICRKNCQVTNRRRFFMWLLNYLECSNYLELLNYPHYCSSSHTQFSVVLAIDRKPSKRFSLPANRNHWYKTSGVLLLPSGTFTYSPEQVDNKREWKNSSLASKAFGCDRMRFGIDHRPFCSRTGIISGQHRIQYFVFCSLLQLSMSEWHPSHKKVSSHVKGWLNPNYYLTVVQN